MSQVARRSIPSPATVHATFAGDLHSASNRVVPAASVGNPLGPLPMRVDAHGLRLALFSDTWAPQVNGVSRTLERLRDAVRSRGGDVHVFTVDDPGAVNEAGVTRANSVPFWAYPQLQLAWPSGRDVLRELRAFKPSLVHLATEFGVGLAGRRAARVLGVPTVTSYHTSFTAYAQYYRLGLLARPGWQYLRWFHSAGERTYCPTRAIVREVEAQGFDACRVWSRGVDVTRFSPVHRSAAVREACGASDDTLVIGYVGRLAAEKGLDTALAAIELVHRARPGRAAFMFVGDGPFEQTIHARTPSPRWLPGKLAGDALSAAYASADVFVFPSTTDTFGNVLLEAMASGLPVIGADVGPTRELLGDQRGQLVPPNDPEALAQALIACVDDVPGTRDRGQAARTFAEACTWDRVWDTLIGDYVSLHRPMA